MPLILIALVIAAIFVVWRISVKDKEEIETSQIENIKAVGDIANTMPENGEVPPIGIIEPAPLFENPTKPVTIIAPNFDNDPTVFNAKQDLWINRTRL